MSSASEILTNIRRLRAKESQGSKGSEFDYCVKKMPTIDIRKNLELFQM